MRLVSDSSFAALAVPQMCSLQLAACSFKVHAYSQLLNKLAEDNTARQWHHVDRFEPEKVQFPHFTLAIVPLSAVAKLSPY